MDFNTLSHEVCEQDEHDEMLKILRRITMSHHNQALERLHALCAHLALLFMAVTAQPIRALRTGETLQAHL